MTAQAVHQVSLLTAAAPAQQGDESLLAELQAARVGLENALDRQRAPAPSGGNTGGSTSSAAVAPPVPVGGHNGFGLPPAPRGEVPRVPLPRREWEPLPALPRQWVSVSLPPGTEFPPPRGQDGSLPPPCVPATVEISTALALGRASKAWDESQSRLIAQRRAGGEPSSARAVAAQTTYVQHESALAALHGLYGRVYQSPDTSRGPPDNTAAHAVAAAAQALTYARQSATGQERAGNPLSTEDREALHALRRRFGNLQGCDRPRSATCR